MDKAEIKQINDFLTDVHEGLCERDGEITMRQQLNELYRIIERLMEATSKAPKGEKTFFASLEFAAPKHKKELEERLGVRN